MAQTLAQITKQIEKLQKEADALRQTELKGVVDRIKVAISHYGLTPDQLGFGKPVVSSAKIPRATTKGSGQATAPRFANGQGQVWSGRGPRPNWLREALANGRSLEEFKTEVEFRAPQVGATKRHGDKSPAAATPAKAIRKANRTKIGSKKTGNAATTSASEFVPAHANAADTATPKARRQQKMVLAKETAATKKPPRKAASAVAKSASQPKAKRLNSLTAAARKTAAAPGAEASGAAASAPTGE